MFRSAAVRALASIALVALVPLSAQGAAKPVVTVFAAASLREAFEAVAPAFTKQTGYPVQFSFAGSDALAAQLLQGAPADVFASANEAQMKRVASLVDAPRTLAHNHLVVIAPRTDDAVGSIADLGKKGVRLILAAASVPVGMYSREALANLGKDRSFGADFAARALANVVSEETDVKAVATKIALGEGDAAVVYATDVTPIAAKVRVLRFPPGVAPPAVYPIAPVRGAANGAGGRAFAAFVTSPAGTAFLKAHGFE